MSTKNKTKKVIIQKQDIIKCLRVKEHILRQLALEQLNIKQRIWGTEPLKYTQNRMRHIL